MFIFKPNDLEVIQSALELCADEFDTTGFSVTLSSNIQNCLSKDQEHANAILKSLDQFMSAPEDGWQLTKNDIDFLIAALHNLIHIDQTCLLSPLKPKQRKALEFEIRAASVASARIASLAELGEF